MRSILLSFILLVTSICTFAQKSLSLQESIKIALQKNTTLQKTESTIPGFESSVKSAYGNLLPSISANGSWNWSYKPEAGGQTVFIGGVPISSGASAQTSRNYRAGAGTNWVLFDGLSNYASIAQSKNELESARFNLKRVKENTVFQTISLYYAVLSSQQILSVRQENLKYNQKNLEIITEKNKLGAVTLADVYNQQVEVGNAELALIQAQNDWETNKSNLLNFLGLNVLEDVTLSDTTTTGKVDTDDLLEGYGNLSQLVEAALNNRSDYQSAKYTLESSYNEITRAKGGFFPQLTNTANLSMSADRINSKDLYDSRTYNVGLTLSIPLFSGWATSNSVQQAKVRARSSEIDVTVLERDIKVTLQKTYLDLQAAKKRLDVSKSNVAASEQNRRIEQEKYNLGSGTLINLLLASTNYTRALQDNISARFDYIILKSQLDFYVGVLDYKKYE